MDPWTPCSALDQSDPANLAAGARGDHAVEEIDPKLSNNNSPLRMRTDGEAQ
jgi:hypothetical protein